MDHVAFENEATRQTHTTFVTRCLMAGKKLSGPQSLARYSAKQGRGSGCGNHERCKLGSFGSRNGSAVLVW
jgi:hypothetical protein